MLGTCSGAYGCLILSGDHSQLRIDNSGEDTEEYIELLGTAGGSLEGVTLVVISDGTGGSGVIEVALDLSVSVTAPL